MVSGHWTEANERNRNIYTQIYFFIKPDEGPLAQWNNASEALGCKSLPVCQVQKETVCRRLHSKFDAEKEFSFRLNWNKHVLHKSFLMCKKTIFWDVLFVKTVKFLLLVSMHIENRNWTIFEHSYLSGRFKFLSSSCLDMDSRFKPLEEREVLACHYLNYWHDTEHIYLPATHSVHLLTPIIY
jgi:hypothetical protein